MHRNLNADPVARKRVMRDLEDDLLDVMKKHAVPLAEYAEDVLHFYTSMMQSIFIAVLTVQAATTEDKTMTIGEHMIQQYEVGRAAYKLLATANEAVWDKPPVTGKAA
jgi:hypothetical protein